MSLRKGLLPYVDRRVPKAKAIRMGGTEKKSYGLWGDGLTPVCGDSLIELEKKLQTIQDKANGKLKRL